MGAFRQHTSMRGRLALLLIALLVLPMSAVGLLAHRSMAAREQRASSHSANELQVGESVQMREELLGFALALEKSLAELALLAARGPGQVSGGLPPGTNVLALDTAPGGATLHPASAQAMVAELPDRSQPFAGYAVLPRDGGGKGLFQVAYQPAAGSPRADRAAAGGVLALRDLAPPDGPDLLSSLPYRSRLNRVLVLADGTGIARSAGNQSAQGQATAASERAALDALRLLDRPATRSGAGPDTQREDDVRYAAAGSLAWGLQPLRDAAGVPVAAALVHAHRADLLAPDRTVPVATRVRSMLGWILVSGVLLALAIAFLAPRWIWGDIRQNTDSIFHSVERLRELVRRNSRALDEQSRVIRTLTSSTTTLKLSSQSIADTTRALAHSAEQSAWVSQSGNQKAELSQRAVLEVRDRVEQISVQMEELERRCSDIGKILGFIDHLSNETNTLSVNAAIQAVGAGSSGRQFSVVAGEIRKLADLALESTRDIQQLIEQIQESSETTLSATHDGCREVDKCLASFEELESAFARILRWVEETTRGSHGIEQSTARQSDSLKSVVLSIEELEQRAGETAGNFHEVVAAADELARLGSDMNETWRVG